MDYVSPNPKKQITSPTLTSNIQFPQKKPPSHYPVPQWRIIISF